MKKTVIATLLSVIITLIQANVVFAGAPTAKSFFTNSKYNRTYTDDNGIVHTVKVTWVGETWNKVGTVIYDVNYDDCYTVTEGDEAGDHILGKATTLIYEDARPTYPKCSHYSVYRINWYDDGHSEVAFDYRPKTPTPTATPIATPKPSIKPTAKPTPMPTPKPTVKPTVKPTAAPTALPTVSPVATATPSAAPVIEITAQATVTVEVITPAPSASPSAMASASPSSTETIEIPTAKPFTMPVWGWLLIVLIVLILAGMQILVISERKKGKNGKRGDK